MHETLGKQQPCHCRRRFEPLHALSLLALLCPIVRVCAAQYLCGMMIWSGFDQCTSVEPFAHALRFELQPASATDRVTFACCVAPLVYTQLSVLTLCYLFMTPFNLSAAAKVAADLSWCPTCSADVQIKLT